MSHPHQRWQEVFLVGLVLGLLELGLVVVTLRFTAQVSPPVAVLVGELLYLLLPAGVGFALAHRSLRIAAWEGAQAGMRVGLVSGSVVTLAASVVLAGGLMRNLISPPFGTHYFPGYSPTLDVVVTVVVWVLLAGLNATGVGLSLLGGLGGAALARWRR